MHGDDQTPTHYSLQFLVASIVFTLDTSSNSLTTDNRASALLFDRDLDVNHLRSPYVHGFNLSEALRNCAIELLATESMLLE